MAKVQLAYPLNGKNPDDVIDVSDDEAKRLVKIGWARTPDEKPEKPAPAEKPPTA